MIILLYKSYRVKVAICGGGREKFQRIGHNDIQGRQARLKTASARGLEARNFTYVLRSLN